LRETLTLAERAILPHLFDAAEKKCAVAFQPNSALWRLLRDDPDRYIYPVVRQGVIEEQGEAVPESALPEFVQKGRHDPKARMFNKQYNLGQASVLDGGGNNLALPTEKWREYVTRRQRCLELRGKLRDGAIQQINGLLTYNLNIRQFAEDVIDTCKGPELLRAFYQAISSVTVLDPTCGSGAFLFAGLNILEPLYEACLDRMQAFVKDLERFRASVIRPRSLKTFARFWPTSTAIPTGRTSSSSRSLSTTFTVWTSWKRRWRSANCGSSSNW
jgi:hypothetical protein